MKIYPTHEQIVNSAAVFLILFFPIFQGEHRFRGRPVYLFGDSLSFPLPRRFGRMPSMRVCGSHGLILRSRRLFVTWDIHISFLSYYSGALIVILTIGLILPVVLSMR